MKKHTLTINKLAGINKYLLMSKVEDMIKAVENTSAVKVYTREEIAAYEASLLKK
jgi:hypothetical protein